jgi:hypothetical protein
MAACTSVGSFGGSSPPSLRTDSGGRFRGRCSSPWRAARAHGSPHVPKRGGLDLAGLVPRWEPVRAPASVLSDVGGEHFDYLWVVVSGVSGDALKGVDAAEANVELPAPELVDCPSEYADTLLAAASSPSAGGRLADAEIVVANREENRLLPARRRPPPSPRTAPARGS